MIEQQPNVDNTFVFEQLWGITNELRHKLDAYSKLHFEPSTKDISEKECRDAKFRVSTRVSGNA